MGDLDIDDGANILARQRMEHDDIVDPVDELRPEVLAEDFEHLGFHLRVIRLAAEFLDTLRTQVGGHHDHGVAKIDGASLAIGQPAIVEHLEQDIEDIRMRLFDFVEQDHRIRPAPDRFGQVTAFFIAHIARWRTDQPGDRVLFHELGHVDAHHGVFGIEQERRERLGQFGFAHAGRPEKQERAIGPVRVRQPGARAPDRIGHRGHGFVLPDHPP